MNADGQLARTAQVVPSTVVPPKGSYAVASWRNTNRGGDGVSVQYVVLWGGSSDPTKYGFDAVQGVSGLPPIPTGKTGGVRMSQADALSVWTFATDAKGTPVVVVD